MHSVILLPTGLLSMQVNICTDSPEAAAGATGTAKGLVSNAAAASVAATDFMGP